MKALHRNSGGRVGMIGMTSLTPLLSAFVVSAAALGLAATAPPAWASDREEEEIPFDEAEIFFELNDTDGDLGIHALIDGEPWKKLEIEDPRGREILSLKIRGRLRRQGLTELFFESAEPTFDELPPARFFRRFPEGEYEIEGETLDGYELESTAEVTHVMPAPPEPTVNGEPAAQQCDPEEPGFDRTVTRAPVTIKWPAVTMSHPDPEGGGAAVQPPVPVEINNYQVVLENGDAELSVILPPDETSFDVPEDFLALSNVWKYEVLAREESFNQTATESCFELY